VIKVLVVDDSALVRKLLVQVFAAEADFEVEVARDGAQALTLLASFAPDVITLDIHMPQMDGLACLDRIMVEKPTPVVMVSTLTADGAESTLEALRMGAVDFVAKPEGAVSLRIHEVAPDLIAKVRAAASARLSPSHRLKDRVRHQIGGPLSVPIRAVRRDAGESVPVVGQGLVLVGTSTGGPPALEALLTPLPVDFPWPILVAQHMPATFTGPLAQRLDRICALTVVEVSRPIPLDPGHVYVGRGNADIIVSRRAGSLVALAAPPLANYPWHPSVDRLVTSAMDQTSATQIVGVLMTGMGNDGAQAMTRLREQGGRTIAEAEDSAVVWGMPGELVKAGGADYVEPLGEIAARLQMLTP
jgi:two-component system chemotaxis response regulator CheB